ncbi:hypothetical protein IAD21_01489 [Abditibacteriota bacterium]|nr:hypothetical protein IAD21_01489 [Abditibacteriota bacterium]
MSSVSDSASASQPSSKPSIVTQLEALVKDLQMPSETDAPIRAFFSPESIDEPKPADYARIAGIEVKKDDAVEMRSLADLLDGPSQEEDWMDDDEKETARCFAELRAFLHANLAEIEVLAWGGTEKQIVVAGRVEGGFAGIVTMVVET